MKHLLVLLTALWTLQFNAQEMPYHPEADAAADIQQALLKAQENHTNLIIQVGGNWCSWCILFNNFIHEDPEVAQLIADNYEYYHLNFSKENKNIEILKTYGNPQSLGFPVLLVLDEKGHLLHTQETGSLEEGKGYNKEKVIQFLTQWKTHSREMNTP